MKRVAIALIRLYPANWRERYGDEFEALLEDNPASPSTVYDLLKGAFKMQLNAPSFPKMAVVLSLVGLLVGLGVSFAVAPRYISTATMAYSTAFPKDFNGDLLENFMQMKNQILSRTSLSSAMQDPRLDIYRNERNSMPLEDVIEKMRADIDMQVLPQSSHSESLTVQISFTYPDATKARDSVQVLITKFQDTNLAPGFRNSDRNRGYDEIDRLEQRLAAIEKRVGISTPTPNQKDFRNNASSGVNLDVIDPPNLPVDPISPKRSAFMLAGFGVGFTFALLIAVFRRTSPPIPFPAQTI